MSILLPVPPVLLWTFDSPGYSCRRVTHHAALATNVKMTDPRARVGYDTDDAIVPPKQITLRLPLLKAFNSVETHASTEECEIQYGSVVVVLIFNCATDTDRLPVPAECRSRSVVPFPLPDRRCYFVHCERDWILFFS